MRKKTLAWGLLALLLSMPAIAQQDALRDDHPQRYTVEVGDTLWDIAGEFLRDSWYWPEIWYENPDIDDPHLIYPGDVIRLTTVDGEPRLTVQRGNGGGTVRLSPEIRVEDLDRAVATIPVNAIRPFLTGARVVSEEGLQDAPYIVASADERVMAAAGDPVYVRGLPDGANRSWNVVRKGAPFVDPETGELLGYEATEVGTARLRRDGDPATFDLTASDREALPGDRLFTAEDTAMRSRFYPTAPEQQIDGVIMAVMDGVSQIGQYDVVALNRGERDGVEVGHVMEVFSRGRLVEDRFAEDRETVRLPQEKGGELIIFRTFGRMSFGLIMEATRALAVNDLARTP